MTAAGRHPHTHAHPPAHHHAPAKAPHRRGLAIALGLGAAAAAAAALAAWLLMSPKGGAQPSGEQLIDQLRMAATGTIPNPHVFGGALTVTRGGSRAKVTAEAVPAKICVQIGWQLAKEGTVAVNGVTPQRISAARLAELCSMNGETATIVWTTE